MNRRIEALKKTVLIGLFLSIPMGVLSYYKLLYIGPDVSSATTDDFVLQTEDGSFITKDAMMLKVSFLINFNDCKEQCGDVAKKLTSLKHNLDESIKTSQQKNFHLYYTNPHKIDGLDSNFIYIKPSILLEKLVPSNNGTPEIFAFDRLVLRYGPFELSSSNHDAITTTFSKLLFDQYLFDYLSTRTFFGPKRKHS